MHLPMEQHMLLLEVTVVAASDHPLEATAGVEWEFTLQVVTAEAA